MNTCPPLILSRTLALLLLVASEAQSAGAHERALSQAASRGVTRLSPLILQLYLPRLAESNQHELGRAAAELLRQLEPQGELLLHARRRRFSLSLAGQDRRLELGDVLGPALLHAQQFIEITETTLVTPVDTTELAEALLSRHTVRRLEGLFTRQLAAPLMVEGQSAFLVTGGEATLVDGRVVLVEISDATRPTTRALAAAGHDAIALRRVILEEPEAMNLIDEHGLVDATLQRLQNQRDRRVAPDETEALLSRTLTSTLLAAADTWTLSPEQHLEAITSHQWQGLYLGRWHLQLPVLLTEGWEPATRPSSEDIENALLDGQVLMVAFEPDGFTAYDLTGVRHGGPTALKQVRYTSPAWQEHFTQLAQRLRRSTALATP